MSGCALDDFEIIDEASIEHLKSPAPRARQKMSAFEGTFFKSSKPAVVSPTAALPSTPYLSTPTHDTAQANQEELHSLARTLTLTRGALAFCLIFLLCTLNAHFAMSSQLQRALADTANLRELVDLRQRIDAHAAYGEEGCPCRIVPDPEKSDKTCPVSPSLSDSSAPQPRPSTAPARTPSGRCSQKNAALLRAKAQVTLSRTNCHTTHSCRLP